MRGLDLARKIPTGIVHINEQTVGDEANVPFGGIFDSGTGTRFGGTANLDAFTETRWITIRGDIAPIPSRPVPRAATLMPMSAPPSMGAQPSVPPAATSLPEMSLPEWLVLAILSQQPAHGFAVAQLTAPGGGLGRVWQVQKAVVYRAIGRLLDAELIAPEVTEPGLGPQRTVYAATPRGHEAARQWLRTPVEHVREIRSQLLLKLALLDRRGQDPSDLLRAQRAVLEPIAAAIEASQAQSTGFDATLLAWRRANAVATLDFLDRIARIARAEPRLAPGAC
jgi:DNA-binding PadR family transcriptional regulator